MTTSKNVLIAGGTGLIGTELTNYLRSIGYNISILTRKPERIKDHKSFFWDPSKMLIDSNAFMNQDYLINLAGESIAGKIWTKKRKTEILQSRIMSVKTLAKGIEESKREDLKIITASAIGYYGDRPNEMLSENSEPGSGFLSDVCQQWEKQADESFQNAIKIRIGIVLSNNGGYLQQIKKITQKHLNVILGDGKQMISWIHINDLTKAIQTIMLGNNTCNIFNLCSPNPVSTEIMQDSISKTAKTKTLKVKIPARFIRRFMGDFSELFLDSQHVLPENLLKEDFEFRFPSLEKALNDLN